LADAKVQEELKGFVLYFADLTERNQDSPASKMAQKFGIQYIPDLRVLKPDGSTKTVIEAREAGGLAAALKAAK
jgi:hypothetical protein